MYLKKQVFLNAKTLHSHICVVTCVERALYRFFSIFGDTFYCYIYFYDIAQLFTPSNSYQRAIGAYSCIIYMPRSYDHKCIVEAQKPRKICCPSRKSKSSFRIILADNGILFLVDSENITRLILSRFDI